MIIVEETLSQRLEEMGVHKPKFVLNSKKEIEDEDSYNRDLEHYNVEKKKYNKAREEVFLSVLEELNINQEKLNRLEAIFLVLRDNGCMSVLDNVNQQIILEKELLETLNDMD